MYSNPIHRRQLTIRKPQCIVYAYYFVYKGVYSQIL